jgi:hypothetical protein
LLPALPVCFSCNTLTAQCSPDPDSSLLPGDCAARCKCIVPHNCGQLNNTEACNKPVTSCNVCPRCCQVFVATQVECNDCFYASDGCNGSATAAASGFGHHLLA